MAAGFDFHKRLGSGYFGEVWHATDVGLNVECAVKVIPSAKLVDPNNFFREAQTLQAAEHRNVVRIRETGKLDADRIYLSMEFLPRGSLEDEAKGGYVYLTRAKRLMVDTLRGLGHAHERGILHRDIKPANILIGENHEGKLADFGLALPIGVDPGSLAVKDYGYILHRAPEIVDGKPYSVASDVYACGVTLYRLVNGDEGIQSTPLADVPALAARGRFPDREGYRAFVPRALRIIINRAMNPDPTLRYKSAEEMRRALEGCEIRANWDVQTLANGTRWSSGQASRCVEVLLSQERSGTWSVTTRHGASRSKLRRINKSCLAGSTRLQAERFAKKVLQDYVNGDA